MDKILYNASQEAIILDERALILFNAMPFGCNLWDKDINIIESNPAILKLFDVEDKTEYARIFFSQLMPKFQPDGELSQEYGIKVIKEAFKTGYKHLEWMYLTKNRELLPLETILVKVKYRGEDAMAAYVRDLRNEKNMQAEFERAVQEKNALNNLSNILNSLDTMIYVTDPQTNELIFINETMKRHYGIFGDWEGKPCYSLLQKGMNEKCDFCPCNRLEKEPEKSIVWEELSTLTGRFYRNTDSIITLPSGRRVHLQHSVDITDFKEMTRAIDEDYKRQTLLTNISRSFLSHENKDILICKALHDIGLFMGIDQIILLKADDDVSNIVCINEWHSENFKDESFLNTEIPVNEDLKNYFISMKNKGIEYFKYDPAKEYTVPFRKKFTNFIAASIFFEDTFYGILDFSRADNDLDWWNEKNINIALLFTNILTSALQKQSVEDQLVLAKELAEQNSRFKSAFLANMSHEIRTPMNAILGIAEIQLQSDSLPEDVEESFNKIYESGNLLLNIINDILDLSKIEAGKLEIIPVKYDIPSLINDTAQLNRLRYESKPIELVIDVDENVPLNLLGDELRIKQILNNILSNSFKYTDCGEVKITVSPELIKNDSKRDSDNDIIIVFCVSDTGQGMSDDQLKTLFHEYTRFNLLANRTTVGTGLGMSITKHLVSLMDGEISAQSELGKGTVITVKLPQKMTDPLVCGPELVKKLKGFRFSSRNILKRSRIIREYMPYGSVLVVDDVESNLFVTKGMLIPYGLKIEMVTNGFDAIEKIKTGNIYDIIFMDHMMPKMDGIEATKIIRDFGYKGFIIALTANALVGQDEIFLNNGFDGFVSKPIDSRELNMVLNDFIRNKKSPEVVEAARIQRLNNDELNNPENKEEKEKKIIYFISDAKRVIEFLEKYDFNNSVSEFTVTIHGIKSALANIGENELSAFAYKLEQLSKERNISELKEHTPAFLNSLKDLVSIFKEIKWECKNPDGDISYLKEKLSEIIKACEALNKTVAKTALNDLLKKQWQGQINDILDNINLHLLHSEFKDASCAAQTIADSI